MPEATLETIRVAITEHAFAINARFDRLEGEVTDLLSRFDHLEGRFDGLGRKVDAMDQSVIAAFVEQREFVAEDIAAVRQDMADGFQAVRAEMADGLQGVRSDLTNGFKVVLAGLTVRR